MAQVSTATCPDLANPERKLRVWFFGRLITTEEEAAAAAFEPRIHDVRELRAECVPQPEEPKVLVGCRKLASLEQDFLFRGTRLGYRQLIMNEPDATKQAHRQSLENPEITVSEECQAILVKVIQIIAALERKSGRSPRLFDAK